MLKLKKTSAASDVSIIIRDKESLLTRPLLQAFALAASLHLIFLMIFHVAPFKVNWSETIFPPVEVEANTDYSDINLEVDLALPAGILTGLPPPPQSTPALAAHPSISPAGPIHYIKENAGNDNPFAQLETEIYAPPITLSAKLPPPAIEIVASGQLSEVFNTPMIGNTEDLKTYLSSLSNKNGEYRIAYNVLVENTTGRIFWFEQIETTGHTSLDRRAEKMLRTMKFTNKSTNIDKRGQIVIPGNIELHFNLRSL